MTKESSAMLCNYEVYSLLMESEKKTNQPSNVATISYETTRYLKDTPCSSQSPEAIKNLMEAVEPLKLTKAEKLQLLNLRPCSLVELQLIVEELDERLKTEEEIEEFLTVLKENLPVEESNKET